MWGALVGAGLGLLSGMQGSKGQTQTTQRNIGAETEAEKQARLALEQGFGKLENIQTNEFGRANQASQSYGNMLQDYSKSGGLPTSADLASGQQFAQQMTAPQQQQIDQSMRDSTRQQQQQAALSGRGVNDFAMNTRLGQQRGDLMSQLGAQQSQIGAQYGQQLSDNRLNYQGQFAQLQQGLASQAMNNRMAIMGLGNQVQSAGQNFRLNSASTTQTTPGQAGSMLSGLTGAFMGAQGGMQVASMFGGGSSNNSASSNPNFGQGLQAMQLGSSAVRQSQPSYLSGGGNQGGGGMAPMNQSAAQFSLPSQQQQASNPFPAFGNPVQNNPWDFNAANFRATVPTGPLANPQSHAGYMDAFSQGSTPVSGMYNWMKP